MRNKLVSEMTIEEVIKLPLFFKNVEIELNGIWQERKKASLSLKPHQRLKAHPIDFLKQNGYWKTDQFILTYAKILSKEETRLSSNKRNFTLSVGNDIFTKTVKYLIDEEKRDNSNRNSQ